MLQNVNLYLPEFRRKKDWLPPRRMIEVAGVLAAVLLVITGYQLWQNSQLTAELAVSEQRRSEIVAATTALIAQYGVQTEDPALLDEIGRLEGSLQDKEALLQFLEGRDPGNTGGFSEHLADLSRFHLQGLSLTGINLAAGGRSIRISGQVLQAELVPLYLQSLSQGQSFAGKNFGALHISEVPGDVAGSRPAVWMFEVDTLNDQPASQ